MPFGMSSHGPFGARREWPPFLLDSREQLFWGNTESPSYTDNVFQTDVPLAALNAPHVRPVKPGFIS